MGLIPNTAKEKKKKSSIIYKKIVNRRKARFIRTISFTRFMKP